MSEFRFPDWRIHLGQPLPLVRFSLKHSLLGFLLVQEKIKLYQLTDKLRHIWRKQPQGSQREIRHFPNYKFRK